MSTIQNFATTLTLSFSLALLPQVSSGQTAPLPLAPAGSNGATSSGQATGETVSSRRSEAQQAQYFEQLSAQKPSGQQVNGVNQASVVNAQWLAQPGAGSMVYPVQYQQAQYQQAQYQQAATVSPYMSGGYGGIQAGYADYSGGNPGSEDELWNRVHRPVRYWAALDYVGLRIKGAWTPMLVTTSPAGTALNQAGVLPNATTLFGNSKIDSDLRPAGELRIGYWLVDGQFLALEGHYLASETESTHYRVESTVFPGDQILAVPFNNNGTESSNVVAFENFNAGGDRTGSIDVDSQSDYQSAGLLLRHVLWADFERNFRLDMIGGYRFIKLDESLAVRQNYDTAPAGFVAAFNTKVFDQFDVENEFHGGEIGLSAQLHRGNWTLDMLGKVALGNNHEVVAISGQTDTTISGQATTTSVGGTFTAATNIGRISRNKFTVMPEAGVKLQFQLSKNVRLSAGYRLLYLNEVIRPGDKLTELLVEAVRCMFSRVRAFGCRRLMAA